MYCANCGSSIDPNAAVCIHCGFKAGTGVNYCTHCGNSAVPGATMCTHCGRLLASFIANNAKSKLVAGLLGIFLGGLGIHNFYLGYTGKAIAQLLITLLTCGTGGAISSIWGLIEGIMLITGSIAVDGNGLPLKD